MEIWKKEIKSVENCKEFILGMNELGLVFHWDDRPEDIVVNKGDEITRVFTEEQCRELNKRMDEMFQEWDSEEIFGFTLKEVFDIE